MARDLVRSEYEKSQLEPSTLYHDPIRQLDSWWQDALKALIPEPNAVFLATVDTHNHPDGRVVLLKSFDQRGLVFYTNYESAKAFHLAANPFAAITMFWVSLERQIRVKGRVEKTSRKESEAYFQIRPRGTQIGTWSSPQSQKIDNRQLLEEHAASFEKKFGDEVPCPPHWGGYRLIPEYFEFWQGRKDRLHDRFRYTRKDIHSWIIDRLAP